MNTAMKIIFAIATMLAHVTAPAESYRLLTASAANSSCVGFELGLVLVLEQETRNRCVDSDRDIPAVPNPENASTAAVISAEILPMDFNGTAEKSIKKNKVRVRDQMFQSDFLLFQPHTEYCLFVSKGKGILPSKWRIPFNCICTQRPSLHDFCWKGWRVCW